MAGKFALQNSCIGNFIPLLVFGGGALEGD
jgi:hypothetical protein